MKRIISLLTLVIVSLSLVACSSGSKPTKDVAKASKIDLNIALGNNQRTITYQQPTPLELPDGTVITQGELKPAWKYLQEELEFELNDVTVQDQKAAEMMDISAATGFKNATVYGGNSIAEELMKYGTEGYFVNILDHLDQMPNFKAYTDKNPTILESVTAFDGGVYHVPYIAEIDNYARMYHGRLSWVLELLDGTDLETETETLTTAYEGFWKDRHDKNVVDLQNKAADGTLNRDTALTVLKEYIAETYPKLEKASDLYLGSNAQYDIDELVALFRVMKLSPNTLSKLSTGKVVDGAIISPYFTRHSKYREDLFALNNYFGGQRSNGSDSYNARLYLDKDGELQYSYAEDAFLENLEHFKAMYSEGLLFSEFTDLNNKENYRNILYMRDQEEGHKQFGFMTFDWTASTTASNEDIVGMLPPVTTLNSDEFVHFVENTRSIKPDGWAISSNATEEERNAALALFDYMFSEKGHTLQSYGIPQNIDQDEKFVGPDGVKYPKLNEWMFEKASEFKEGDVSAFLRDYMGSLIPIGYQKEIGFEYQYTTENGFESWKTYEDANVITTSYDAEDPYFKVMPPVFSVNEQEMAQLNNIPINEEFVDSMFLLITGSPDVTSHQVIKDMYKEAGIDDYIKIYRDAYTRMIDSK